jgi:hypothetical protein
MSMLPFLLLSFSMSSSGVDEPPRIREDRSGDDRSVRERDAGPVTGRLMIRLV